MVERNITLEYRETPKSEFVAKLERLWTKGNFVCVGLDSDYSQISEAVRGLFVEPDLPESIIWGFNREIVDATHDLVCAYKPNMAFYEAYGSQGWKALKRTVDYIKNVYPEIPIILDAKRADIGNTNLGYVTAAFDELGADAVTVHPYLGKEALKPFLDRKDKGIFVLVKTSNPGAGEFQNLPIPLGYFLDEMQRFFEELDLVEKSDVFGNFSNIVRLNQVVAYNVARYWNENGNCAVVVGATYPNELADVRKIVGDMPILIPGIGVQGGEVEATVNAGKDSRGMGMIINSSRGIIFASKGEDFAQAARKACQDLREEINRYRI